MLITNLTATACAVAAICLGRSEYEKKALSVEEMNLYSDKVSKDRTFIFLSDRLGAGNLWCIRKPISEGIKKSRGYLPERPVCLI